MARITRRVGSRGSELARVLLRKADFTASPGGMGVGILVGGVVVAALTGTLLAGPQDAQVVHGSATINTNGSTTTITASNGAIINYSSFNVGSGETVRFVQPSSTSRVLNRINSAAPTQINGTISANGIVYFVNPAGVYFGAGAVVDVAGMYAAAANMTNQDFLRGIDRFTDARGAVVSEGYITANFAALIGARVEHSGAIVAPEGTVVMAAGRDVVIAQRGSNVQVRIQGPADGSADKAALTNTGSIDTSSSRGGSGRVVMGAGDALGLALFTRGNIRARDTRIEGQGTGVVAVSGTIDASNDNGNAGRVVISGEKVALRDASIDASGSAQGGQVLIGGDYQGQRSRGGPARNAERTFVSQGTTIDVSSTGGGDGGRVIVWSEQGTAMNGTILAKGGPEGGDGGFVEVSSKGGLALAGKVDVRGGGEGADGTVLLDPQDIIIQAAAGPDDGQVVDETVLFADGGAVTFTIGEAALEALTGNVILQATRDITVQSGVTLDMTNQTSGEIFQLLAGRNIAVNGSITTAGAGIDLRAGDNGGGSPDAGAGMTIGGTLDSNGGLIALFVTGSGGLSLTGNVEADAGNITLTSTSGVLQTGGRVLAAGLELQGTGLFAMQRSTNNVATLSGNTNGAVAYTDADAFSVGTVVSTGLNTNGANVEFDSGGVVTLAQNVTLAGALLDIDSAGVTQSGGSITANNLQLRGTGTFTLNGAGNAINGVAAGTTGSVSITTSGAVAVRSIVTNGVSTDGGDFNLNAGGAITLQESINAGAGTVRLATTSGGALQAGGSVIASGLNLSGTGAFVLQSGTNNIATLAASTTGAVAYRDTDGFAVGTVTATGITSGGSNVELDAGGTITLTQGINAGAGIVDLATTSGGVSQGVSGGITAGALRVNGVGNFVFNAGVNDVDLVAGSVTGGFQITDADDLVVGTLVENGLTAGGSGIVLRAASLTINQAINETNGVLLIADAMAINANINGGSAVALQTITTGASIGVAGGAGLLQIDASELARLLVDSGSLSGVTIGASGGGAVTTGNLALGATDYNLVLRGSTLSLGGATLGAGRFLTLDFAGGGVQGDVINVAGLRLLGGSYDLNNPGNTIGILAGNTTGTVGVTNNAGLTIGSVLGTNGLNVSGGNAILTVRSGALTLAQNLGANLVLLDLAAGAGQVGGTLTAQNLLIEGDGPVTLNSAGNDIDTLAIDMNGAVSITDVDALTIGQIGTTLGVRTGGADAVLSAGSLAINQGVNVGAGNVRLNAANGVTQASGAGIVARGLALVGGGAFVLDGTANDTQILAADTTGAITYADSDGFTIGAVGTILAFDAASATLTSADSIFIDTNLSADTALSIWSGTDGTGDITFNGAFNVDAQSIALRAGDGLGGAGTGARVAALPSGVAFRGAGGTGNPNSISVRQDASIIGGLLAEPANLGAGDANGLAYSLRSDDGAINLAGGDAFEGAALTLQGQTGINISGDYALQSFDALSGVAFSGDVNIIAQNGVAFAGDATATSGQIVLDAGAGTVALSNGLNVGAASVRLIGSELNWGNDLIGSGTLELWTRFAGDTINLGGSGDTVGELDLTSAKLADLADGWTLISIGRPTGDGLVRTLGPLSFLDPVQIRAPRTGGVVRIDHAITQAAANAVSIAGGTVRLNAGITTAGGAIRIDGPSILGANITLDSTNAGATAAGADVTLNGADSDSDSTTRALTLRAGSGGVATVSGDAGVNSRLASFTASGSRIDVATVRTTGAQQYTSDTTRVGFRNGQAGASEISSSATGSIVFTGDVRVGGNTTIASAGAAGNSIGIGGDIDSDSGLAPGGLSLLAGAGDVVVSGQVGAVTRVTSFEISGANVSVDSVLATGNVRFTGNTSLVGGAVEGSTVRFDNDLSLTQNLRVAGTTSVVFGGVVGSAIPGASRLEVISPSTSFEQGVGGNSNFLLGLSTSGGAVRLAGGTYRVQEVASFGGDLSILGDTTIVSDTRGVEFLGAVDGDSTARSLTVFAPQEVFFSGNVGQVNPLRTLDVAAPVRFGGGTIRTTGAQGYSGAVVLDGNTTFDGRGVAFTNTINSGSAAARSLTVNAGQGIATFTSAIGGSGALSSLSADGAAVEVGGEVRTTGSQTYKGLTRLSGNLVSTGAGDIEFERALILQNNVTITTAGAAGDDVRFAGTINAITGGRSLSVNSGAGAIVASGAVGTSVDGDNGPVTDLAFNGGTIEVREVRTSRSQVYTGATTLRGNLTSFSDGVIAITGATTLGGDVVVTTNNGAIVFGGNVDSDTTARDLTVSTGGNGATTFAGAIGGERRLDTITTNADGTTRLEGGSVRTLGNQSWGDAITISADTTFEGPNVQFTSTLDSDNVQARALTVNTAQGGTNGVVTFGGNVGTAFALQRLRTVGSGATRVGANITTTSGIEVAGPTRLLAASRMNAGSGAITFRGTIDTESSFSPASLELLSTFVSSIANGPAFRFGGRIGNTTALSSLRIGSDLVTPPAIASVVFSDGFDDQGRVAASSFSATDQFSIRTTGDFTMGRGQKILSFGRFSVNAGGTATIGDIVSLADINISGNAIRLLARPGGPVADNVIQSPNDTVVQDAGMDIVAAGDIVLSRTPTVVGSGVISFANNSGRPTAQTQGFTFRQFTGGVRQALFADTRPGNSNFLLPLDLRAQGPSSNEIATSLAGALPRDILSGDVAAPATISPEMRAALEELGVQTRDLSIQESIEFLVGRRIYRDAPQATTDAGDYSVTVDRLSGKAVDRAVESYRALVFAPMKDDQGRVVTDAMGRPRLVDQSPTIRNVLGKAWEAYAGKVQTPTGLGLRALLENRGRGATPVDVEALRLLNEARSTLNNIDAMGLSAFEASIPRGKLLRAIKPEAMPMADLEEAITGLARENVQ